MQPKIIISLTSYPARINTIDQTIKSLINQSKKADKIILWLAPEQFPNKEKDLPRQLLDLTKKGLTIDWYHDIKSYKKLIPTLKKYPNDIIVTADDDNIYPHCWLKKLYKSYLKYPKDIQCHRITKFYYNNGFKIISGGRDYYKGSSFLNKLVGLGGVLYPPQCFYKDILNEELIFKLAPTNDDQWFWLQAVMNGTKIRVVKKPEIQAHYIEGTQETGLHQINDLGEKLFWKDFNRLLKYYPQISPILQKEYQDYLTTYNYEKKLKKWYRTATGKKLNLKNPKTFNEKIQWLKLYDSTPIKTLLADKYLVRDWVKEKIGEKYLIPCLGVYDSFNDIDFSKLPDKFVIKCNHGSGWNIIVKDKSRLDLKQTQQQIDLWMEQNFAFQCGYEMHYYNIPPKIIIEQYMEDSSGELRDYKFTCFNGKPEFIWIDEGRFSEHKRNLYDLDWNLLPYQINTKYQHFESPQKPECLPEMLQLAEKLSSGFPYVRTDFYVINNKVYFGEMTFTSGSGSEDIFPKSFDKHLSQKLELPKMTYNFITDNYSQPRKGFFKQLSEYLKK